VTADRGAEPRSAAAAASGVLRASSAPTTLRDRLAETEDRLRRRVAELAAEVRDRRHLEAELAVRSAYLASTRAELEAVRDELARTLADRDAVAAERDRLAATAATWRRDALLLDRLRRSAHRLPLYVRLGHPVLRRLLHARRSTAARTAR
jgi:hypothetical protein